MELVVIRPPLVYGPGVKANFESMMKWLAKGIPLPLSAITGNRRSLVALDNLIDLILTYQNTHFFINLFIQEKTYEVFLKNYPILLLLKVPMEINYMI